MNVLSLLKEVEFAKEIDDVLTDMASFCYVYMYNPSLCRLDYRQFSAG